MELSLLEMEKYLIGDISLTDLDNYMISAGFETECDGDIRTWLNDRNVVYSKFNEEDYELVEQVQIFFEIKDVPEEGEIKLETIIKITDVTEF